MNFPTLKVELTGIRQSIQHMFSENNQALSEMIAKTIEETITQEWIQEHINQEVSILLEKSISNISDNWDLKNAVRDLVAKEITGIIKRGE